MDPLLLTVLIVYGVAVVTLLAWVGWLHYHTPQWGQIERVKTTLAEQEEALAGLFDRLNMILARWRKREQRERDSSPDRIPAAPADRKAALRRRAADLRGLPHPSQLQLMEERNESVDQDGAGN